MLDYSPKRIFIIAYYSLNRTFERFYCSLNRTFTLIIHHKIPACQHFFEKNRHSVATILKNLLVIVSWETARSFIKTLLCQYEEWQYEIGGIKKCLAVPKIQ